MNDGPRDDWRSRLGPLAREAFGGDRGKAAGIGATVERLVADAVSGFTRWRAARRAAAEAAPARTRLLWLLPLPLLPAAAFALGRGDLAAFALDACAYALLLGGTLIAQRGLRAEALRRRQRFAPEARVPAKLLGWLTVGLGTALAATAGGYEPLVAAVFGLGAAGGCTLLYGLDPRVEKAAAEAAPRVAEALARAEQHILAIEAARDRLGQPELVGRLDRIAAVARRILAQIADDPADMRRARRFLVTYLAGAERVATGYAARHGDDRHGELETSFRRVLITIEQNFEQQYQRLLAHDLRDLDVQIEVLEQQLRSEGLQ